MGNYRNVFSPLKIGNIEVKNRIETPPMFACMATPDGFVTRELTEFYQAFARGGAGIVTVGDAAVDFDRAFAHYGQINLGDARVIGGLNTLVEAVQKYGAKISIEINHAGRWVSPAMLNGKDPIGPSSLPTHTEEVMAIQQNRKKNHVIEMDQDMIDQIVESFANSCQNCLNAGFEMVMIHGGHGHLISQFASPYSNKRMDNYGGSLENRARFAVEVLTAIRRRVGNRLALEYRISADEMIPQGMHLEETIEFIKIIEDLIDIIHVSLGIVCDPEYAPYHMQPTYWPHAFNIERVEQVKREVKIPVACVGSIMNLEMADKIIEEGKADIVAMGRPHLADPEIVRKSFRCELDNIRPCIRCGVCSEHPKNNFPVRCAVNPMIGRDIEYRYRHPLAHVKKKVIIAGGGPAGMEAALVASERGHMVTLYEKESELGGALRYAAAPPFKADMKRYLEWLIKQTMSSHTDIRLSTEVNEDIIRDADPDVLILALGARPFLPDIPGISQHHVVNANEVDAGKVITGDRVVVAGAGLTGCETALFLAQQGKQVTLMDMISKDEIAQDAPFLSRMILPKLFEEYNICIEAEVKLEEITSKGVLVINRQWLRHVITADTVVLSLGVKPCIEEANLLKDLVLDTYVIGDCMSPRDLKSAIHDAFNIAMEI